ncbi:MAG: YqgE/AlgH family protein [Pseudomonadota bacterium]
MAQRKPRVKVAKPSAKAVDWLGGELLVAMPGMTDPRFSQAVICLCSHSPEGAMGIVLNRPIDGMSFDVLLRQLGLAPVPPARRIRVIDGGPVEGGRGFVLHSDDWSTEGSLPVRGELALTANVEVLKAIAEGGGPRVGVLALGYAGWAPGQLDAEIQRNAWLSVPADEALLFEHEPEDLWRRALAKLRIEPVMLSGAAGRA